MKAAPRIFGALLGGALLAAGATAGTTIDLTAEASRPATNDMVRATVYAEASGSNPAELARRVNQDSSKMTAWSPFSAMTRISASGRYQVDDIWLT